MTAYATWFPGTAFYRSLEPLSSRTAGEPHPQDTFPWSERHLCGLWADSTWRPPRLDAGDGRVITVENPGRWNLEAGPDFLDAILHSQPDGGTLRGDIEIHIRPSDWTQHGHGSDPRYAGVVAHITYFEAALRPPDLPATVLQIALRPALKANPLFSFDSLDLQAYPHAILSGNPPCAALLRGWSPERRILLLESAGEERLRLKAQRLLEARACSDTAQLLYEEIMGGLGYKHNRQNFIRLARLLPLARLRQDSAGDPLKAYALLAGVSGLLPARPQPGWSPESRSFIRGVWDHWWKLQTAWSSGVMQRTEWTLANIRPTNAPLRRLMAAAQLFTGLPSPIDSIQELCQTSPPPWPHISTQLQATGRGSFWSWHSGLAAPRSAHPSNLIGAGRAAALINNILVPWSMATNLRPLSSEQLRTLPSEDDHHLVRHTAFALFGHDQAPALYSTGLRQQGVLQIYNDFCLGSRGGCSQCRLPDILAKA